MVKLLNAPNVTISGRQNRKDIFVVVNVKGILGVLNVEE